MKAALLPGVAMFVPAAAWAHGAQVDWHAPPSDSLLVLLPLLLAGGLFIAGLWRREVAVGLAGRDGLRAACFFAGLVSLLLALVWPLDAWSGLSFAAHMGQHMVLLALAPPLLVLARPGGWCLRGLPAALRPVLVRPRSWPGAAAWRRLTASCGAMAIFHGAVLWGWHVPAAFELALRNDFVHWLEHVTLLGSGLLFWRAILRARGTQAGWALLQMLATVIHSGLLGALLALAPRPLYRTYALQSGEAAALADQQLAGLIMWVPMGTVYLLAALAFAARALEDGGVRA